MHVSFRKMSVINVKDSVLTAIKKETIDLLWFEGLVYKFNLEMWVLWSAGMYSIFPQSTGTRT